jgi:hypothetical protein
MSITMRERERLLEELERLIDETSTNPHATHARSERITEIRQLLDGMDYPMHRTDAVRRANVPVECDSESAVCIDVLRRSPDRRTSAGGMDADQGANLKH